ncbi:MAG TPA: globin domain-containing protein [Saprospiraceae bacterium]|nr:globin domain-containing protein [Saprospiraceae bacterium]
MQQQQIVLVKKTWKIFRDMDPVILGEVFYGKLFLDKPGLRKLFPKDMSALYSKFTDMMSTLVARLDQLEQQKVELRALGLRHAQYGVKPDHHQAVGQALCWALKHGLGNDWNNEVEEAWTALYEYISENMIQSPSDIYV